MVGSLECDSGRLRPPSLGDSPFPMPVFRGPGNNTGDAATNGNDPCLAKETAQGAPKNLPKLPPPAVPPVKLEENGFFEQDRWGINDVCV